MRHSAVKRIAVLGLISAIVVILQLAGSFIKFGPFSVTLVLLPIVVGASLYGIGAGAWLGFVFGMTVLLSGDAGAFLAVNVIGTVITVLLKGILAGAVSGLLFCIVERKRRIAAAYVAAASCPIVNTGVFLMLCPVFFLDTIAQWAQAGGASAGVGVYMITVLVGVNFLFELAANLLLAPILLRIIEAVGSEKI